MKSWITDQHSPTYWLATASVYQEAIHQLLSIDGATPLFDGKAYEVVMSLSPWLVPASSLAELHADTLNKGMILTSKAETNAVLAHLRSLLTAGLEGEEVLFRFYDPQVILPMLALMNEMDRHALLGNLTSWSAVGSSENHESNIITYSNKSDLDFSVNRAPWWVIKAEHFEENQNIPQLAHHIERRLWATLPQVISKMSHPKKTFIEILQNAQEAHISQEDAQLMLLATLIVSQSAHIETVSKALSLSWDEEKRLQVLVEEMA